MNSTTLQRVVRVLAYASFITPLIVLPTSFIFPFIVPKIIFFRSTVILMAAAFALLILADPSAFRPRTTPLSLALLIFLVSATVSTFVGTDAYHSFWDNHERMLGLFTLFHYVAYYFIITTCFRTTLEWKQLFRWCLLVGSVVMIIGVLQVGNPELLLNQGSERVASSLGNPIYVGGFALFLLFTGWWLLMHEKDLAMRVVLAVTMLLAVAGLFFSGTKGSMLGLIAGLISAAIGYGIFAKEHPLVRRGTIIGVCIMALVLGGLFMFRASPSVRSIPALGPLLNVSLTSGTGSTRVIAWKIAIESWKERPMFGWGPNNFFYAFNKHYNPRSLEFGYGETWFDNAHNIILNTLSTQGIVGLVSYLGIFVVGLVMVVRALQKGTVDVHSAVIGGSFMIAHLVQNATVFENPTSYLYFMVWLAFLNRFTLIGEHTENAMPSPGASQPARAPVSYGKMGLAAGAAVLIIFITNIQPARANRATLRAMATIAQNPLLGLEVSRIPLTVSSPHIDDIRNDLARQLLQAVAGQGQALGAPAANQILSFGEEELLKNLTLHPADIRVHLMLAQIYQLKAMTNQDARHLLNAEFYLQQALTYTPRRQQFLFMLATVQAQLGKQAEAIAASQKALELNPQVQESYWRLAYMYNLFGDNVKAREIIQLAEKNNVTLDPQGKEIARIIMAGESVKGK